MEKCVRILKEPCNGFLIPINIDSDHVPSEIAGDLEWSTLPEEFRGCLFRAVSIDRLPTVLKHGIDVEPTNSVIWAIGLDKALEYGEWPKLVMALDHEYMKRTFAELDANASEEEQELVRRDYPTFVSQGEGLKLFFSRLTEDDPQLCTNYEFYSAWWIPGNPWDALKGIFILFRPKQPDDIESLRILHAKGVNPVIV